MGLESGTEISDLVSTNPTTTDKRRQGDDHLRLIKNVLKTTFPNINGVTTPTLAEFNFLLGVTSLIQTQLDARLEKTVAPGTGMIQTAGVLDVQGILGIVANADDVQIEISGLVAIEGNALDPTDDGYLVNDDGVPKHMGFTDAGFLMTVDATTARTLVTADINSHIEFTNGAAVAVTLNTGFGKKGNWIVIEQGGAGQVTVSGTATINGANGLKTAAQYSNILLVCKGSDVWVISGDAGV